MYSRSLCDSNLQGTNKRNDKESRWESFLLCSTNFSSFFLFFLNFQNDFNKQTSHHPLLLNMTHELYLSACPKKCIVFPDDRRFELLWSDSKFSYHISIKEYTKFYAYIVCLDLNLWILVKKMNEITLCKHSYKFLFLVRFLQYWFMWPHV